MSKHTPGDWYVIPGVGPTRLVGAGDPQAPEFRNVALVYHPATRGTLEANAHLIAAAPLMYDALRDVIALCPCDPDINPRWEAAWLGAIDTIRIAEGLAPKATGRQESADHHTGDDLPHTDEA